MEKLNQWLWAIAISVLSALLIAYAYDIEQGTPIGLSNTQAGRQEMLIILARGLGFRGSIILGGLATSLGIYFALLNTFRKKLL